MIVDGKPEHWPKMLAPTPVENEQTATRALAVVRQLIVAYYEEGPCDWRPRHAKTDYIVNVVAGLIADSRAVNALYERGEKQLRPLEDQIEQLREELAESKRPFTAQMVMQNRRIIALNSEVDALKLKLLLSREGQGMT